MIGREPGDVPVSGLLPSHALLGSQSEPRRMVRPIDPVFEK